MEIDSKAAISGAKAAWALAAVLGATVFTVFDFVSGYGRFIVLALMVLALANALGWLTWLRERLRRLRERYWPVPAWRHHAEVQRHEADVERLAREVFVAEQQAVSVGRRLNAAYCLATYYWMWVPNADARTVDEERKNLLEVNTMILDAIERGGLTDELAETFRIDSDVLLTREDVVAAGQNQQSRIQTLMLQMDGPLFQP